MQETGHASEPELNPRPDNKESQFEGSNTSQNKDCENFWRGISMGSFGLLLNPAVVGEIIEPAEVSPVPGVSRVFRGFCNRRGKIIPVYDVLSLVNQEKRYSWDGKKIMVFKLDAGLVALTINQVPQLLENTHELESTDYPVSAKLVTEHAQKFMCNTSGVWILLDYDSFFADLADQSTETNQNIEPASTVNDTE